ncbi:MAG: hypothetical protein KIB49_04715 [Clostridiales bacterium]|nr:hypothetical protein [Clostridiales bacterium]
MRVFADLLFCIYNSRVHITFAGMQYLQEYAIKRKAANLAKGIEDVI